MPVQQLVQRAQAAAPGTEQAGGLVEEANRIEMILPRVKAEQHQARRPQRAGPAQRQGGRADRLKWNCRADMLQPLDLAHDV